MTDEALTNTLVALFEQIKTQHELISSLAAELASVRETVSGLDPTFSDVMTQKREYYRDRVAPEVMFQLSSIDEVIAQLKKPRFDIS